MNNTRRKSIQRIINGITALKEDLEVLLDEEQEYLDNIPENLQESDRALAAEDAIDNLSSAQDSLEEVVEYLSAAAE